MGLNNHALWQLATKALIYNDKGQVLTLTTPDGYLDFPGGRVDESERATPWTECLQREVAEELGDDIKIEIGDIAFVTKRQYSRDGQTHYIAAMYFTAHYVSGDITLSEEHGAYAWATPADILAQNPKFVSTDEAEQLPQYFAHMLQ